jgi:hypothetical protein
LTKCLKGSQSNIGPWDAYPSARVNDLDCHAVAVQLFFISRGPCNKKKKKKKRETRFIYSHGLFLFFSLSNLHVIILFQIVGRRNKWIIGWADCPWSLPMKMKENETDEYDDPYSWILHNLLSFLSL